MTISCSHDLAAREENTLRKEEATSLLEGVLRIACTPSC